MNKFVMPGELTAGNGAKKALMGEFFEEVKIFCPYCQDDDDYGCELCGGKGQYTEKVPVSWATIERIYKRAVLLLGEPIEIDDPDDMEAEQ